MKIVTVICNVALLGFTSLLLFIVGISKVSDYKVFTLLLLLVPILNIVLIFGSQVSHGHWTSKLINKAPEEQGKADGLSKIYPFMKIVNLILNLALLGFASWFVISNYPHPGESLVLTYILLAVLTPVLSLIAILISRTNKVEKMKRIFISIGVGVGVVIICFIISVRTYIGLGIKERINIAKQQYSGMAEDALITYLSDTTHAPGDRSDVAIWTLGQIRSKKALPILKKLYKNDPEGKTCKYRHNTVLCQYEIHKAIVSIEHKWLGAIEKNWFGSWSRLNANAPGTFLYHFRFCRKKNILNRPMSAICKSLPRCQSYQRRPYSPV
ncbi:MAG: HEAT repeat domain-containing protein [Bacteroidales bacterium]